MDKIKIALASDHGGFNLKNKIYDYLIEKGYNVVDFGTNTSESVDYPLYADRVCQAILAQKFERGILVCGTGLGMSMMANRFKGIRAACVSDIYSARMSREHNDSNVLTLGERVIGTGLALDIVDIWLETKFLEGRHLMRIRMFDE